MEFHLEWLKNPARIGAIAPTSKGMARKMASLVRPESDLPVLELGPGTGVITRAILELGIKPANLIAIEFCKDFLPGLRRRYPGVRFVHGDAFEIGAIAAELGVGRFDTVVSALPLLNFKTPARIELVNKMLDHMPPGRPMVQFSYGLVPPIPPRPEQYSISHLSTVLRNLPPARLWTYRRQAAPVNNPVRETPGPS